MAVCRAHALAESSRRRLGGSLRPRIGLALVLIATAFWPRAIDAQARFTTQRLFVLPFDGRPRDWGQKAADIVRDRVAAGYPGDVLWVVDDYEVEKFLNHSSYNDTLHLSESDLKTLADHFRIDERITGTVTRTPKGVRVEARLSVVRDVRNVEPFAAEAATLEAAAETVGREMMAARRQLDSMRECENLMRDGEYASAAEAAKRAVKAYPRATLARVCLLYALGRMGTGPDSILSVARAMLSVVPDNAIALEFAARSYDAGGDHDRAAVTWLSLLHTDTTREELFEKVGSALVANDQYAQAVPVLAHGMLCFPANLNLLKLAWQAHAGISDWEGVISTGEALLARDSSARVDPDIIGQLAKAYRAAGHADRALALSGPGTESSWSALLARDSMDAELVRRATAALSRERKFADAAPIIDRGVRLLPGRPDLVRLQWLVHLALSDWKGAIRAGQELLSIDDQSRGDPTFHARLANAYRADGQSQRALLVALEGSIKFPTDTALYLLYAQTVRAEGEQAIPRARELYPRSAALQAMIADVQKSKGDIEGARNAMRAAVKLDPDLPHAYVQLAEFESTLLQPDSVISALEHAAEHGESPDVVAQYALFKGDSTYRAAAGASRRIDLDRARRYLAVAVRARPLATTQLLLGASAVALSQIDAAEAAKRKSCEVAQRAAGELAVADASVRAAATLEPSRELAEYVLKLQPYVSGQVKSLCP